MIRRLIFLLSALLLIGCATALPTEPDQPTSVPTQVLAPTLTPTDAPIRTPAIIAAPTLTAAPLIVAPPGLLYITGDRMAELHPLWVVDASGKTRQIAENVMDEGGFPDFDISLDGTRILYAFEGDIWRLDIATGIPLNLTNTPDRIEMAPRWIGQERAFVCGSVAEADADGPTLGQLTYVDLDNLIYRVVDEAVLSSIPAPHPSGEVVLYTTYASDSDLSDFGLKEFRPEDESIQPVTPADYGLQDYVLTSRPDVPNALLIGSLSWNADGSRLGMALTGEISGEQRGIFLVIDWQSKQHFVLHTSPVPGIEAPFFNSAPRFPTQVDWIVFEAPPANSGSKEIILAQGGEIRGVSGSLILRGQWAQHPAISPDNEWVAFLTSDGLALMRTDSWQPIVISAQDVVIGVGWVTPPE